MKSGPAFQKAEGSELVAVMRRDRRKAEDFAARHHVPKVHSTAEALIEDPSIDAVYIATPPSSHLLLALQVARAGKPCLVEKPMAMNHAEAAAMVEAFARAGQKLWVAYYRRAQPRFLRIRQLLGNGAIGRLTSIQIDITRRIDAGGVLENWRVDPAISGAGLFFDLGSHCLDLVDFLAGPVSRVSGSAVNTGRAYAAEDAVTASFVCGNDVVGTGIWNFNADAKRNDLRLVGTAGEIATSVFDDVDVVVVRDGARDVHHVPNPAHVHQPLVQTIIDELRGRGPCESTGQSGARTQWVLDECVKDYYRDGDRQRATGNRKTS